MSSVIVTCGLTKRYGRFTAVDRMNLDVHEGDLFGFLGPNGSGKTTTARMLLGLVFPTSGAMEVLGRAMPRNSASVLPELGVLIEGPGFYPHLSGRTNLELVDAAGPGGSRRDRRARISAALERVDLGRVGRKPVKTYSTGMRQRLGLAATLLRRHRLLVLDEPTNGLDPQGVHEIRSLLTDLVAEGTTVFLSSHLLSEVEAICTRAAIVHKGRLVAQDTVAHLLAPTGRVWVHTPDAHEASSILPGLAGPRAARRESALARDAGQERILVHLDGMAPDELNRHLVAAGVRVRQLVVERRTLEEVFLDLTAPPGADAAAAPGPRGGHADR
ncbi:ABC transporter ATP-binding protein [soil metagenome]